MKTLPIIKQSELKQSGNILLLGNDLFYLKIIKHFLELKSFKVKVYTDIVYVINNIDLTKFDLIISEVYLQKQNVEFLTHYIKENKIDIKIFLFSEYLVDQELIKYFSQVDEYMSKPLNLVELYLRIIKILNCQKKV